MERRKGKTKWPALFSEENRNLVAISRPFSPFADRRRKRKAGLCLCLCVCVCVWVCKEKKPDPVRCQERPFAVALTRFLWTNIAFSATATRPNVSSGRGSRFFN